MTFTTCDSCVPGIANGDWTHVDDDEEYALILANAERYKWPIYQGPADIGGYFDCDVCWGVQCGGGHTFSCDEVAP